MKRFFRSGTAWKAVVVGVVISGMATACQNGNSPVGDLLGQDENTAAVANSKANGATAQSEDERKAEQARKIAEFLAKPEVKEMSSGLEEIAQAVAVAVEDKALRDRIYEKCMEKFDGETNTLWMHLEADSKLKTSGGWNKRIDAELGKGRKNATVKGIGNIDAAIKKFEKVVNAPLHLFWMYPSSWDKKTTPLVAFVPFDVNPKTRTSIPAFDSKGNRFALDSKGELAKQRPVIVVNINERTQQDGSVQRGFLDGPNHESPVTSAKAAYNHYQSQLDKNRKAQENPTIQNWYAVTGFTPGTIWISGDAIGFENEPAWGGTLEYFYTASLTSNPFGWSNNQNFYLGTAFPTGGAIFYNSNVGYSGPADGRTKPMPVYSYGTAQTAYVHYWEADFPGFDDYLVTHTVPRQAQTNGFVEWVVTDNPLVHTGHRWQ